MASMSDFQWKPGQVVVVEGDRHSMLHKLIAWSQGWWWTHCFLVVAPDRAVEATFPKVQEFDLPSRVASYLKAGRQVQVLDRYLLTDAQRAQIAAKARTYVGRWYNVFAVFWYFFFKTFNRTGGGSRWFCSRLITASYRQGAGIDLTTAANMHAGSMYTRLGAMRDGYVTPAEVQAYLGLVGEAVSDSTGQLLPML